MASAMRKMAVYLGLVEDDHRYPDKYDSYGEYEEYEEPGLSEGPDEADPRASKDDYGGYQVPEWRPEQPTDLARITTLHPRTYNEARTIGEHFREGTPVIMNLTEMEDRDAKRLVDFAAGLAFAMRGSIDKVTNKVFLLSPPDVEVSAEDRRRIAEGRLFN